MTPVFRVLLLSAVVLALTSCLSTEVELDLRNQDELILDLTYRMPIGLWEFGVFDDDSPERAIPVSRRDAEETAILSEDVTLVSYTLREEAERAVVHVVYRAESVRGLQDLWGQVAGTPLDVAFESGQLVLPISSDGPDEGVDPHQRDLIADVFAGEVFSVTILTPGSITAVEFPRFAGAEDVQDTEDRRIVWRAPMGALLSAETAAGIRLQWEQGAQ